MRDPSSPSHHLGLDLGGTNLKWAVVERAGDDWRLIDQGTRPTLADEGTDAVVGALVDAARTAIGRQPAVETIGVGVPGLYDPAAGTVRFLPNFPDDWAGVPVAAPIATATGLPVALINDARAFGLAELRLGAGRGARSMVGVTLGTGVGGVIAVHGRVHQGHDGTAGELGHQTIERDGLLCTCGNRGCLEAYTNAEAIARACGTASPEAAVAAAHAGDERALTGFAEIGSLLGIGIANMVTVITPDRVVIGGGTAAAGDLLLEPIRAEVERRVRTTAPDQVEIVTAALGIWAGSMGAAVHGAEHAADAAGPVSATRPT